jgi:hypothetical protein
MLSDIEKKKKRAELFRVQAAREEMELFIIEKEIEIKKVMDNLEIQKDKEQQLKEMIGE